MNLYGYSHFIHNFIIRKKYGLIYSRYFYETCLLNFISHKILLLLDKAVLGKISVLDFSCLLDN